MVSPRNTLESLISYRVVVARVLVDPCNAARPQLLPQVAQPEVHTKDLPLTITKRVSHETEEVKTLPLTCSSLMAVLMLLRGATELRATSVIRTVRNN